MSRSAEWAQRIYNSTLRLYPAAYRRDFGAEMQAVFGLACEDAQRRGAGGVLAICARELLDMPTSLGDEYGQWISTKVQLGRASRIRKALRDERVPSTSPTTGWLAALPCIAILLLLVLPEVLVTFGLLSRQFLVAAGPYLKGVFAVCAFAALVVAWRRGWPRVFAGWYPIGVFFLGEIVFRPLQDAVLRVGITTRWSELALALLSLSVPGIIIYALAFRDRLLAIQAAPVLVALLAFPLEYGVPQPPLMHAVNMVCAWLAAAATSAAIARTQNLRHGLWRFLGLNLALALTYGVGRALLVAPSWFMESPFWAPNYGLWMWDMRMTSVVQALRIAVEPFLRNSLYILVPLLLCTLRGIVRQSVRPARVAYIFASAGLTVGLSCAMAASPGVLQVTQRSLLNPLSGKWLPALTYDGLLRTPLSPVWMSRLASCGVALFLLCVLLLGPAARGQRLAPNWAWPALLLSLLLVLSLAQVSAVFRSGGVLATWPLARFVKYSEWPPQLFWALGLGYLLLATWRVVRADSESVALRHEAIAA